MLPFPYGAPGQLISPRSYPGWWTSLLSQGYPPNMQNLNTRGQPPLDPFNPLAQPSSPYGVTRQRLLTTIANKRRTWRPTFNAGPF